MPESKRPLRGCYVATLTPFDRHDTLGRSDETSLKDTVTLRDRDSMQQIRLPIDELLDYVKARI